MGLSGLDIGNRGHHALPQTQQVVDAVRRKLPHLYNNKERNNEIENNVTDNISEYRITAVVKVQKKINRN